MKKLILAAILAGTASTASATGILPVQDDDEVLVVGQQGSSANTGLIIGGLILGGLLLTHLHSSDGTN